MKAKAIVLLALGVLGAIFVCTFDILTGKPVNDISGPKSILALVFCVILVLLGVRLLLKKKSK
ncbi:MAG: hypothetical protein NTZ92_05530 [Candidatus Omnitrophica bacterium]|nr:hypothetical protein [Candidatus Omnitrophota bacterium]